MTLLSLQTTRNQNHWWDVVDTESDPADQYLRSIEPQKRCEFEDLRTCMARLNTREQQIIRLAFGFDGEPQTVRQIALRLRMSKSTVDRVKRQAIQRMRQSWPGDAPSLAA